MKIIDFLNKTCPEKVEENKLSFLYLEDLVQFEVKEEEMKKVYNSYGKLGLLHFMIHVSFYIGKTYEELVPYNVDLLRHLK